MKSKLQQKALCTGDGGNGSTRSNRSAGSRGPSGGTDSLLWRPLTPQPSRWGLAATSSSSVLFIKASLPRLTEAVFQQSVATLRRPPPRLLLLLLLPVAVLLALEVHERLEVVVRWRTLTCCVTLIDVKQCYRNATLPVSRPPPPFGQPNRQHPFIPTWF